MKLAEILDGPNAWCQGYMRRGERLCLIGALAVMLGRDPGDPDVLSPTSAVLDEALRLWALLPATEHQAGTLIAWNDAPHRTWEQVAALVEAYDRDRMLTP